MDYMYKYIKYKTKYLEMLGTDIESMDGGRKKLKKATRKKLHYIITKECQT